MLSDSSGAILDLMPATGARGSDDGIGRSRSHRGEEDQLTDLHRNIEMFSLVTKRTGHAAAPRGNDLNLVVNGQFQSLYGGGERRQSLLVAMPVKLDMAGFLGKPSRGMRPLSASAAINSSTKSAFLARPTAAPTRRSGTKSGLVPESPVSRKVRYPPEALRNSLRP